jgi:hypothetical protein
MQQRKFSFDIMQERIGDDADAQTNLFCINLDTMVPPTNCAYLTKLEDAVLLRDHFQRPSHYPRTE